MGLDLTAEYDGPGGPRPLEPATPEYIARVNAFVSEHGVPPSPSLEEIQQQMDRIIAQEQLLEAMAEHGWTAILLGPKSKIPTGPTWQRTRDPVAIDGHIYQGGNVGLECCRETGLAVLDFDVAGAFAEMCTDLGPLLPTVQTAKGHHCYVRWEPDLPAKILWKGRKVGEVQRGPNQQVVAPPSIHPDTGKPYLWSGDPLAELPALPDKWRDALKAPAKKTKTMTETAEDVERARRAARKKLDEEEAARSPELLFRKMSEAPDEKIIKAFGGRLIRGTFGPMCGPGEAGKGVVSSDIIARFTTGEPFPGERTRRGAVTVLVCVTEDSEGRVKARLRAAGADLDRVISVVGPPVVRGGLVMPSPVKLDSDAGAIVNKALKEQAGAFWLETMLEHLGDRENSKQRSTNNEADVREALAPFRAICKEANLYGWGVMHPRKAMEGGIEDVISGSAAFRNVGRLTMHVYNDPCAEGAKLLFVSKANYLAGRPPTLVFHIEPWERDPDEPKLVWHFGTDDRSAEQIWQQIKDRNKVRRDYTVQEAEEVLRDVLSSGMRHPDDVYAEAKSRHIAPASVVRAKQQLGVESVKAGYPAKVVGWRLPTREPEGEM